jgi:SPP1 gp7 family putative phage head morphogenesis protein
MIVRTLAQQVGTTKWEIRVKEEFQGDGVDYTEDINEIMKFFKNPNDNDDSFEDLLVAWATDTLELDSGVGVKVFNKMGDMTQIVARDGATFLKNPSVYGMMSDRADIIPPLGFDTEYAKPSTTNPFVAGEEINVEREKFLRGFYDANLKQKAAYFQYGWTAGRMPIPFGRREIVWFSSNKRTDTIYGRSPVEVLGDVLFTLLYGSSYSLDMFINNNIPAGIVQIIGANNPEIEAFKHRFEDKFIQKDVFSNQKKQWWNAPVVNQEVKWTPFNLSSTEMQVLESQFWYLKIVASCFGLTPSELGFTEDSNKAVDTNQGMVFKRKALAPLIRLMQQRINTQVMPEFRIEALEFVFDDYDFDDDKKQHDLLQQEINMGIKTSEMVAEELGINVEELKRGKEEERAQRMEEEQASFGGGDATAFDADGQKPLQKSLLSKEDELASLVSGFFDDELKELETLLDQLPKDQLRKIDSKSLVNEIIDKAMKLFNPKGLVLPVSKIISNAFTEGSDDIEKQFDMNVIPNREALMAVEKMTFENISGATDDFKNKLRGIISRGVMNNRGVREISKDVREQLQLTKVRADTIARTEVNAAYNEGGLQGAKSIGIDLDKIWDANLDSRTSPVCNSLDGTRVGLEETFSYEGESFMRPPSHPNCRSRLRYIPKEEKE